MKKIFFIFLLFLCLSFNMFTIPSMAQSQNFKEGLYKVTDLNLSPNITHTIENNSDTDYAFIMIFDSNQITQQLMKLNPKSKEYMLTPLEYGYQRLVVTNGEITIN